MLNRFITATSFAIAILFLNSPSSIAQDVNSKPMAPVPDPVFSAKRATGHRVKGKLLIEALEDIEMTRELANQTASDARREAARLLAFDWELEMQVGGQGQLRPGSAKYSFQPADQPDRNGKKTDDSGIRIPKQVAILAIQIQQGQGGSFDSGQGSGHQGVTEDELDLICGPDWIISWLEDENGHMIPGSAELHCGGQTFGLPLN